LISGPEFGWTDHFWLTFCLNGSKPFHYQSGNWMVEPFEPVIEWSDHSKTGIGFVQKLNISGIWMSVFESQWYSFLRVKNTTLWKSHAYTLSLSSLTEEEQKFIKQNKRRKKIRTVSAPNSIFNKNIWEAIWCLKSHGCAVLPVRLMFSENLFF
jgi:hypothetical protein